MRIEIYLYLIVANGAISLTAEVGQCQCSLLLQAVFVIVQILTFCLLTTNSYSSYEETEGVLTPI